MSRRRNVSHLRNKIISEAISADYRIQRLEQRLLFTTFPISSTTGLTQPDPFEYEAEGGTVMRIYYHDITFEAIGVSVDGTTNATNVGDLIPASTAAPVAPILARNLFAIYVTQSAPDSYITIAPVARLSTTPTVAIRADQPFGAGHTILVDPADGLGVPYTVTPGAGIGGGVLGAYTLATAGGQKPDIPITEVPDQALGVYPGNLFGDGLLHAGLYVPNNATTGLPQSLEAFKFAGEIFGNVEISGNIQLFYAGAILTGDATGILLPSIATSASALPNFTIGGDIRDLITSGDIGGDVGNGLGPGGLPNYDTGFSALIGGKVGEVYELNGGFFGTMHVEHLSTVTGLTDSTPEQELEYQNTGVFIIGDPGGIGQIFQGDNSYLTTLLPDQLPAPFTNNTDATAQYLGSAQTVNASGTPVVNQDGNIIYDTLVTGTLNNAPGVQAVNGDPADWYAVSMLAGVTMNVTVSGGNQGLILAELEDPDGRIVSSDVRVTAAGTFQYTTDRPGIYRIGLLPNGPAAQKVSLTYTLTITGTGNEAIGEVVAGGDVSDMGLDGFLTVDNGDFGALVSGASILSGTEGPTASTAATASIYAPSSIIVARGDLRDVTAGSIGAINGDKLSLPLYLSVPNGNIGLLDSTGVMVIETQFDPNYLLINQYKTDDAYAHAIGGNIEVINAGATLYGLIGTNAGIGTIRAANMATTTPSHFDVNADNSGNDGIIDLIDVPGQFGVLGAGPEFVTNTGGNIRYLNVGGPIFLPTAFGGETDAPVTYAAGSTNTFTDDSGARFTVTAGGPVTTVNINNSDGTVTQQSAGTTVTVLSYPVLDKAGLIPISISSNTAANVSSGSMTISGIGSNGAASQVDVANINITGEGRPIGNSTSQTSAGVTTTATDAYGNTLLSQPYTTNQSAGIITGPSNDQTDEFLSITGPAKFNVLNINAGVILPIYAANSPVEVENATQGEVVNLNAPEGLGTLIVNGNLGFATPQATPAAVLPIAEIANADSYPFFHQHTGVVIGTGFLDSAGTSLVPTGNILSITVGGAAGNIEVGQTLQSLIVNSAESSGFATTPAIAGQFDGIVGPVVAQRLLYVDVGQGLAPSGSGAVALSGLYATGKIGLVTNAGNKNGDIRGDIVSAEDNVAGESAATFTGIDAITVSSASIINATIATIADNIAHVPQFQETSPLNAATITVETNGQNFAPGQGTYAYDVGPITVSGAGGIIGTRIYTGSVASLTVNNGGFGILETTVFGQNAGKLGSISASGYGIRESDFEAFGYIGLVSATGNGKQIPVTAYPIDVRPSDLASSSGTYFGVLSSLLTDINAVLGTSLAVPVISDRTDTGVVEDDIFNGQNDFAGLTAQKTRTELPLVTSSVQPTPNILNVPTIGVVFANSITFGGAVGTIKVNQETDGLQITAGSLAAISLTSSVDRLGLSIAGAINSLVIHGNLGEYVTDPESGNLIPDSYVNAGGPEGTIGSLRVFGNLNANVYATSQIGNILVTGDLLGGVVAYGGAKSYALVSLRVFGGIRDGSLILHGNVGSIIINRTLGTSTGSLTIQGNANLISVGANHALRGSQLALALDVTGTLKSLIVYGSITGSVTTGLDLTHLTVTNDGSSPNSITGAINVGGRLGSATITGGNVTSNIISTGTIGSFTINRGNLNAGATVQSQLGVINSFRVTGGKSYGVYGSILAAESTNGSIDISGNLGDGVNAAVITAYSGKTLRVRGNVAAGASVTYSTYLNLLRVDGSVLAGATITAHPIKKQTVLGTIGGTIVAI
jgi:hypothetical protein